MPATKGIRLSVVEALGMGGGEMGMGGDARFAGVRGGVF